MNSLVFTVIFMTLVGVGFCVAAILLYFDGLYRLALSKDAHQINKAKNEKNYAEMCLFAGIGFGLAALFIVLEFIML